MGSALAKYRGAIIGLGWMGMLYDIGDRMGVWHVDDVKRPTPDLDVGRRFHYHDYHVSRRFPTSYSEAFNDREEIQLVAAAERDRKRLQVFGQRYAVDALYTDAFEMLETERPDIVGISSNTKGRADLTCCAVQNGAKGIITEKPIAITLEEADRMVQRCADADVPLCVGAISTSHPSLAKVKELLHGGAIGELVSMEASSNTNMSQHQNWAYFVDGTPAWVVVYGDEPPRESGSGEFRGQGMMVTAEDQVVFFRKNAPMLRLTGSLGEIMHESAYGPWKLWQTVETAGGQKAVEVPWPNPQMQPLGGAVYGLADIIECMEGRMAEPKNSGRSVAMAFEVELAMKLSAAQGGARVELPLPNRDVAMEYDWHR